MTSYMETLHNAKGDFVIYTILLSEDETVETVINFKHSHANILALSHNIVSDIISAPTSSKITLRALNPNVTST